MNEFNLEIIREKIAKALATTETGMEVTSALVMALIGRIAELEQELKNLRGVNT